MCRFCGFAGPETIFSASGRREKKPEIVYDRRKIPQKQRDRIPVLAKAAMVWLIGYRISEYYKVTAQTKQILEVAVDGGEK